MKKLIKTMEELRKDYVDGEKFYAEDMNQITHTVNKLNSGIVMVADLPETGETGVVYITPNYDDNVFFECNYIEKNGNKYYVSTDGDIRCENLFVGDVVKINNTGHTTYVLTSVDPDNLKIITNGEIQGVLSAIETQREHYYKVTGVYDNIEIEGSAFSYFQDIKILTFSEIQGTEDHVLETGGITSVYSIGSGISTYCHINTATPLVKTNNTIGMLDFGDYDTYNFCATFNIEIGDKFKYIGQTGFEGGQFIAPTSVNEDELSFEISDVLDSGITGIVSYEQVKTNQCYEVTGVYHIKRYRGRYMEEYDNQAIQEMDSEMAGNYYADFQVLTFKEIENDDSITKERIVFPSFRPCFKYATIENVECYSHNRKDYICYKRYIYSDGVWLGI